MRFASIKNTAEGTGMEGMITLEVEVLIGQGSPVVQEATVTWLQSSRARDEDRYCDYQGIKGMRWMN